MSWLSIGFQAASWIPIPGVGTVCAIGQAIAHACYGNYVSAVICLMGAVPIPYANKITKILGDYVGKLIALGVAPTTAIKFIARILGNLTRCSKAFQAVITLVKLYLKYKNGSINWTDFEDAFKDILAQYAITNGKIGPDKIILINEDAESVRDALIDLKDFMSKFMK
jgi:hypothetical protein